MQTKIKVSRDGWDIIIVVPDVNDGGTHTLVLDDAAARRLRKKLKRVLKPKTILVIDDTEGNPAWPYSA